MNASSPPVPPVMSLAEVAAITPWSERTLRALCRAQRIEHVRIGRRYGLTPDQYRRLLDLQKVAPTRPLTAEEIEEAELAEVRAANARPRRAA